MTRQGTIQSPRITANGQLSRQRYPIYTSKVLGYGYFYDFPWVKSCPLQIAELLMRETFYILRVWTDSNIKAHGKDL